MARVREIVSAPTADSTPIGIGQPASYLPRLESLRGIAILLVFLHHAEGLVDPSDGLPTNPTLLGAFVASGHTGVTLFFILSAFLLSPPFIRAASATQAVSTAKFFERRALRILPLYWVTVIVSSVLYRYAGGDSMFDGLPYLVFLNSFAGLTTRMFPFSDVWWSLATEVQFYLLLPVAGLALRSRIGRWLLAVAFIGYCIAYAQSVYDGFHIFKSNGVSGLYGRLPAFAFGAAAAWFYGRHGARPRVGLERRTVWSRGGADALLIVVVCLLGLLLRKVANLGYFTAEANWHAWHVVEAVLWTVVVLLVAMAPLKLGRVFDSRSLKRVGVLSYSLYLVHLPILFIILFGLRGRIPAAGEGWNPTSLALVGACLAVAIGLSSLTYAFIERPFLVRKARIAR
jgi:peptidoglycan/LPS O-acetylase OafA/YrhL